MNPRTRHASATAPVLKPSERQRARQIAQRQSVAGRRLGDFLPLLPAEQLLLECCRLGQEAKVGDTRSESPDDANQVRASFVRFLLLGGDEGAPVHERGVQLLGAWLDGMLDLGGCAVSNSVSLIQCHFDSLLFAQDASITGLLNLGGSCLARGMAADRL